MPDDLGILVLLYVQVTCFILYMRAINAKNRTKAVYLGVAMYVDYLWLKLGVIVLACAIYGFWKGFTGR